MRERERGRGRSRASLHIRASHLLLFPAQLHTHLHMSEARAHAITHSKMQTCIHGRTHSHTHTHTYMHAAHSVREGSASLTQLGKIRLLCNSEICNLHVNNPWSAASPGRSASSLSLPTPLALCVPILSLPPQTSSSIPPSLQPHLASPDCKYRNNRERKKTEAGYSQRMREGRELLRACAESQ